MTVANGFVRGAARDLAERERGTSGAVLNADGEIVGHMRGIARQRRNRVSGVLRQWVNREGQFAACSRQTYANGELRAKLNRSRR